MGIQYESNINPRLCVYNSNIHVAKLFFEVSEAILLFLIRNTVGICEDSQRFLKDLLRISEYVILGFMG